MTSNGTSAAKKLMDFSEVATWVIIAFLNGRGALGTLN
jgi:hypothetical protein